MPSTVQSEAATAATRGAGRSGRAWAIFLTVSVLMLGADLLSKHLAFARVPEHRLIPVIPKVLGLERVSNHGAIFGIGQGQRWFFVLASVVAMSVIGRLFWRSGARARATHIALALILAGALGNLYDRLFFGFVRDMLHLFPEVNLPFGWSWPIGSSTPMREVYPWIFNLADVSLLVGVLLLGAIIWRGPEPRPRPRSGPRG